jgi:hypothetical protein
MESRVLRLPSGLAADAATGRGVWERSWRSAADAAMEDADLVLAFLPPGEHLERLLAALAERFPQALVVGCEAVTQFAGDRLTNGGTLHQIRFHGGGAAAAQVIPESYDGGADGALPAAFAEHVGGGGGALLFADGLRCPVDRRLRRLRQALKTRGVAGPPAVVGGLASQGEPVSGPGARPFHGRDVVAGGCVALLLSGVRLTTEVVRGWDPASPLYTVTRADGNVLWEIDGEPAVDWFRRFFTVGGATAPLPATAHRFPLIIEGPDPARHGLYRSMRAFDEPAGAVTFWGDLDEGDLVRLGMGNEESLVRRAENLSTAVTGEAPEAAVLVSCVGRERVLGDGAAREVAAVSRALGGAALSGFFSFGEIGPTPAGGPAFYNHTAVLGLLEEEARA